ncbi:SurA N-terminal domain-containing protein [Sulfurihydrogenibium sp.]|uniref:SurA N-terminal domain-containing protein n=1 Tax=Sulfurihydrogenibium sp. TaxID=2053621 RepID=UPI00262E4B56|nr:SurA N-terminal domain-containing protein [Sulfurihydrogenibium sp.]
MFDKISQSKWKNIVLFITVFAFVATSLVAIIVYKLSGEINGVAEVNGKEIPFYEFNYAYEMTARNMQMQNLDISNLKDQIKKEVVNDLIEKELLYQEAEKEGITATSEQVKNEILKISAFQVNGKFDKQTYLQIINSFGLTPDAFENILRKELSVNNLKAILLSTIYVSDEEIETFTKKQLTKVSGEATIIKPNTPEITEDMIKKFYEEHKKDYSAQTGKNITVYKIDIQKLGDDRAQQLAKQLFTQAKSGNLQSVPAEVEKVFEGDVFSNQEIQNLPKEIQEDVNSLNKDKKVSFTKTQNGYYISLFNGESLKSIPYEQVRNEIKQKLERMLSQKALQNMQKTTDITQLLKQNKTEKQTISDNTIQELVVKFGIKREDLNKLANLKVGETSKPISTENGILIFKLTEIKEPDKSQVDEMKKTILPFVKSQKFNDVYQMYVDSLKKKAKIKINKRVLENG